MKKQEARSSETMHFDRELSSGSAASKEGGVTRRSFMGGMGAMMAAAAAMAAGVSTAHADEAAEAETAVAAETEEQAQAAVEASLSVAVHQQGSGWLDAVASGEEAGEAGSGLRIEAVQLSLDSAAEGSISYSVDCLDLGWTTWASDGETAGTTGLSEPIVALKAQLSGSIAESFDLWYRVHLGDAGWTDWAAEGEVAGDESGASFVQAIQVSLLSEGEEPAEESSTASSNYPTIVSTTGWTGTPEDVLALGVSTMPLEDLNQYRQAYMDAQGDYTMEDGTVVPAVYNKMRALINSYGMGCGNTPQDASFTELLARFTEDEAQAYIDMPLGVNFTAYEMAEKEGRDLDYCEELCERMAQEGFLCAIDENRGRVYHHIAYFQGVLEYQFSNRMPDVVMDMPAKGSDMELDTASTGTPTFYFVPVDASVTSDGTILPFDDLKEKVRHANVACISPCQCRYLSLMAAYGYDSVPSLEDFATGEYEDYFSESNNLRIETCIQIGDEAAYWIEQGWGRQITGEQAAEYLQRSVDDGFMLETTFGKDSDTICSCYQGACAIINFWNAIGDAEAIASCDAFKQVSHYTLEVDSSLCTACGLCVDRCPMQTIAINDEGWAEAGANCFRCGQCAYVCPQGARKLVQRDESELAPLPQNMLEDSNVKAAYRFEKQLITFPEA